MRRTEPRRFRFAPSPNGPLHLGHAYSAMLNHELAAACNGVMLLRMENIDMARCAVAYEAAIRDDLAWLGVGWDGPVRRQSEHFDLYAAALDRLAERGLLYPCFCTRGEIAQAVHGRPDWPKDPDGSPLYPGTCRELGTTERRRRLAGGEPASLRLDMMAALQGAAAPLTWHEYGETAQAHTEQACPEHWGDAILRRKDIPASYHVAVVVDDAAQRVTDIVRGRDLFAATALHRLLQVLLGYPEPAYHHHRLVLGPDGQKLSKSRHARSLTDYRRAGATPGDIGRLLGSGQGVLG